MPVGKGQKAGAIGVVAVLAVAIAATMSGQPIDQASRAALADRFDQRATNPLTLQERDAWISAVNTYLKRCPTHKLNAQNPDAMMDELNDLVRSGC
jgi:hypothetical protein